MMRHWNLTQENIYKIYEKIGKQLVSQAEKLQGKEFFKSINWEVITKQGLWALPVSKEYGGAGFTWDECVIAIEGLTKNYRDAEFFSSIISHFAVLYLLLQYGTQIQKNIFIYRLMRGEISKVYIKDHCSIYAGKLNIAILNGIRINIFIKNNTKIYIDYINFKRLLYGVLAAKFTHDLMEECKKILIDYDCAGFDIAVINKYKEAENNLHKSRRKINLLFSYLTRLSEKQIPCDVK